MCDRQGKARSTDVYKPRSKRAGLLLSKEVTTSYLHTIEESEDCVLNRSLIRGWILHGRYEAGMFYNLRWTKALKLLSCSPTFLNFKHEQQVKQASLSYKTST
jgi:hypothetical protein